MLKTRWRAAPTTSVPGGPVRIAATATAVFIVILLVLIAASCLLGLNVWVPVLVSATPWLLILRSSLGLKAAFALTTLAVLSVALLGMVATSAAGITLVAAFSGISLVSGVGGALLAHRSISWVTPSPSRVLYATGPAVGAVIWIAVIVASRLIPGSGAYGWVMNGDSANNILFARSDVAHAGIQLGSNENPVPLPVAILALGMSAGRGSVPAARLLEHDLTAFVGVWTATIALLCVMVGVVISSTVAAARPRLRWLVGALASVLPLTWLVVGYPVEYGFFNIHVALVIVLAAWLVFRLAESRPAIVWGALAVSCTLLLAVWSPIVLLPAALMVVVFIRSPRALWAPWKRDRALAISGTAQLIIFGVFVTAPSLFAQAGFLAAGGAAYPFSKWLFVIVLASAAGIAILGRRSLGRLTSWGLIAEIVAVVVAYAILVFAARGSAHPFSSYYQAKLQWVAMLVVGAMALSFLCGLISHHLRHRVPTAIALVGLTAATVVFVQLAPTNATGYPRTNPIILVLAGKSYGPKDRVAESIIRFADVSSPTIFWNSGRADESAINFWVLDMQSGRVGEDFALREAAYGEYDVGKVADLCRIARLVGTPLNVVTADLRLSSELVAACPAARVRVVATNESAAS